MNTRVKEFIEKSIKYIEAEDYYKAFDLWYEDAAGLPKDIDYLDLRELFSVFSQVGIELEKDSLAARQNVIDQKMYDYMDAALEITNVYEITLPTVLKSLDSDLEVSLIKRNEIFKEVANRLKAIHDITIAPFRIKRNK